MKMNGVLVLIGGSSLIAARYLRGDLEQETASSSSFVDYKKGMTATKTTKKEKKKQVEKNKKQSATADRNRRFFRTDTELLKFRRLLRRARSYTPSVWDEQELRRLQRRLQARVDSGDLRRVDVVKLNDWLNLTDYQYNHYRIRPRSSWTWWR
eukprot:g18476.t1